MKIESRNKGSSTGRVFLFVFLVVLIENEKDEEQRFSVRKDVADA